MTKDKKEKIKFVKGLFGEIHTTYDLLNHLLSGFQDIHWRKFTSAKVPPTAKSILDIATGTGDLAFELARTHPNAAVAGIDFVPQMLQIASQKLKRKPCSSRINLQIADALKLPFADNQFDAATVAFAFRNIPDIDQALLEMKRVVKPGGKVLVLEMTLPQSKMAKLFFKIYLKTVIPFVGLLVSGNKKAYNYLSNSIENFMQPLVLKKRLEDSGLKEVVYHPLTLGITCLHEGIVP